MNPYLITFLIILLYLSIAFILNHYFKNNLSKRGISFFGPILLWRTTRGKKLIDSLARCKLFWKVYATIGLVLLFFVMFIMVLALILGAYGATLPSAEPMPMENMLVLPGINPIIPLWYGLISLIIAVIIHEFAHGILARVADIKLKSLGVVLLVIPIGAFVEPDENKLRTTSKLNRDRVFAAGPAANIFVGLVCAMIFAWGFMGALEPVRDGVLVLSVTDDYPADISGIEAGMMLVHIEGNTTNGENLSSMDIHDHEDFSGFLDRTHANDTLNITVYYKGRTYIIRNITLADRGGYFDDPKLKGKGFLGIGSTGIEDFSDSLAQPVRSAKGDVDKIRSNLIYLFLLLPLSTAVMPFHEPLTDVYEVNGPLDALPTGAFWFLANVFFYLFWINILVGLFNALPAIPLDGGYPYRDAWDHILKRINPNKSDKDREATVNNITVITALTILFLIMWAVVVPYL